MTIATQVQGKILQVFGPVVDVQFPEGHVPNLYNAITVVDQKRGIDLVLEVAQQLGNSAVRCVAMSSTDGMSRGMPANDTGAPISVPVGDVTRGRLFDVLGRALEVNVPHPRTGTPMDPRAPKKRPASASGAKTSFSASMPDIESGVFTAARAPRKPSRGLFSRAKTMLQ